MNEKLKIGNEIKIKTRDGSEFKGIFMKYQKGYVSAVISLGIVLTIPLGSVLTIVRI